MMDSDKSIIHFPANDMTINDDDHQLLLTASSDNKNQSNVGGGVVDDDAALSLSELRERFSLKTYEWLLKEEEKNLLLAAKEEEEAGGYPDVTCFFGDGGGDGGGGDGEEEEEKWIRVQKWRSSKTNVDGFGGCFCDSSSSNKSDERRRMKDEENGEERLLGIGEHDDDDDEALVVQYILSDAGGGHGDDLWAASRHVANLLADAESCRDLLSPLLLFLTKKNKTTANDDDDDNNNNNNSIQQQHPLMGIRFLELGAGAGLPSWTAMWCGAIVVCTDQAIPNRIRCMAESAQRNLRAINNIITKTTTTTHEGRHHHKDGGGLLLTNAQKIQICPYDWGTPTTDITNALLVNMAEEEKGSSTSQQQQQEEAVVFDVIVAADCVYMPQCHNILLQSIDLLLSANGVALLPFALHGNTHDNNVWDIVKVAEQEPFNFHVEKLGLPIQLTPQAYGMDSKRALVHMLRFTRKKKK